jgi:serine/threonine protein kinase
MNFSHQSFCIVKLYQCRLGEKLGSGQFGNVLKGVWHSSRGKVAVAVKTLKEGSKKEDRVKFLQEAAIMGQFKHPNVLETFGVVTIGEPVCPQHTHTHSNALHSQLALNQPPLLCQTYTLLLA